MRYSIASLISMMHFGYTTEGIKKNSSLLISFFVLKLEKVGVKIVFSTREKKLPLKVGVNIRCKKL